MVTIAIGHGPDDARCLLGKLKLAGCFHLQGCVILLSGYGAKKQCKVKVNLLFRLNGSILFRFHQIFWFLGLAVSSRLPVANLVPGIS